MLNQISPAPPAPVIEDAVDVLTGCHSRIRHFTNAAVKLAHAQGASAEEVAQIAARVHRYYSVSLPLHEADEEETLQPRLSRTGDERVRHALQAMHEQHEAIDELLERLMPLLVMVMNHPSSLHQAASEMCSITKALDEVFNAHLEMEEGVIFPAIRTVLPSAVQDEMLREMRERRKTGARD